MKILGIDPGFTVTGFAIMKKENGKIFLLDYGALKMSQTKTLAEKIEIFFDYFCEKIKTFEITDIALETPFLGKNAQNFLKLGYLRGILYLLAQKNNLKIHEYAPREVKMSVTGYGAADKEQVARVVTRLFLNIKTDKLDITDALAVTLCALWKTQNNQLLK
ncbi:crossover junction endodeoxyribonuclease RuvC [Candidatus Dependentiae bacterium]|nr:crossover junction endodeoxyribonuclease RuvC [Candidatus Dependentiae bacterium]